MIVTWLIGFILSFLGIWFLKNSRYSTKWRNPKGGQPILKLWVLILLLISAVISIINIIVGVFVIVLWIVKTYWEIDWEFTKSNHKIIQLLNKPIK